jgi:hypothetical protein
MKFTDVFMCGAWLYAFMSVCVSLVRLSLSRARALLFFVPPLFFSLVPPSLSYFRAAVTSSAEMKVKTPPTKLLDKTIWNPRPETEIDLAPRAVSDESNSFRLF